MKWEENMSNEPIFEVREIVSGGVGRSYRIWADGRTEGFNVKHIVLNRIEVSIWHECAKTAERVRTSMSARQQVGRALRVLAVRMALRFGKVRQAYERMARSK